MSDECLETKQHDGTVMEANTLISCWTRQSQKLWVASGVGDSEQFQAWVGF